MTVWISGSRSALGRAADLSVIEILQISEAQGLLYSVNAPT